MIIISVGWVVMPVCDGGDSTMSECGKMTSTTLTDGGEMGDHLVLIIHFLRRKNF